MCVFVELARLYIISFFVVIVIVIVVVIVVIVIVIVVVVIVVAIVVIHDLLESKHVEGFQHVFEKVAQ